MRNQHYIKSKLKVSEIIILTIGAISTISLGTYLISNGVYIFGGSILFFGLYFIYILLNYDILYVNYNEILIKSITGKLKKKIELKFFKYYTEIEKENSGRNLAHRKWKDLTLVSEDFSYKISSSTYSNYQELQNILTKIIKRNKNSERDWKSKNELQWGYGLVITSIILGTLWFQNGIQKNHIGYSIGLICFLITLAIVGGNLIRKSKNASR